MGRNFARLCLPAAELSGCWPAMSKTKFGQARWCRYCPLGNAWAACRSSRSTARRSHRFPPSMHLWTIWLKRFGAIMITYLCGAAPHRRLSPCGYEACWPELSFAMACRSSPYRIARDDVAIERCAQLRRAALGLEVDVVQPKTLLEAVDPFEIIHQAPQEIAAHRHPFGSRALQLRQIIAQVHDAVEIVDVAVGGDFVVGGGAVLADIDRLDFPDFCGQPRYPVGRLGADPEPIDIHMRERGGKRQHLETRRAVDCHHVVLRRIDVQADEIVRRSDDLQLVGGKFRGVLAGICEKAVGVFALQDHAKEAR